jgi:hypothetical protein
MSPVSNEALLSQVQTEGGSPALVQVLRKLLACACPGATGATGSDESVFSRELRNDTLGSNTDGVETPLVTFTRTPDVRERYLLLAAMTGTADGVDGEVSIWVDSGSGFENHSRAIATGSGSGSSAMTSNIADIGPGETITVQLRFRTLEAPTAYVVDVNDAILTIVQIE